MKAKPGRPRRIREKTVRLAIVLGISTLKALEDLAVGDGRSRVDWIRWTLEREIARARKRAS